jgi:hypothetical protein
MNVMCGIDWSRGFTRAGIPRPFRPAEARRQFAAGRIDFDAIRPRIMSWIGHARHAGTYRLRTDLPGNIVFQRATAKPSSPPGRDVHQSTGERPLGEPQQERAGEP